MSSVCSAWNFSRDTSPPVQMSMFTVSFFIYFYIFLSLFIYFSVSGFLAGNANEAGNDWIAWAGVAGKANGSRNSFGITAETLHLISFEKLFWDVDLLWLYRIFIVWYRMIGWGVGSFVPAEAFQQMEFEVKSMGQLGAIALLCRSCWFWVAALHFTTAFASNSTVQTSWTSPHNCKTEATLSGKLQLGIASIL